MNTKILSHEELQHIEHCNKILIEHKELVTSIVNETEQLLNNYIPILSEYVNGIRSISIVMGESTMSVIKSSRELKVMTGGTQDIYNFTDAVLKLEKILTPELMERIERLVKK